MFTLAFDTTSNFCSLALFNDNNEVARFEQEMDFGQAEVLMPQIAAMLREHNLEFKNLNLAVVCTGPGSFTGVRSSVAAARAFALAAPSVTVCGVSAFDTYAADFAPEELAEVNVVLIETKREDYYVQYYDAALNKLSEPATAFYDDIIRALQGKSVSFAGDGVERFLNKPSGSHLHAVKTHFNPPVDKLALIGIKRFLNKTTDFPKPLYLKAPDVCVK